jgi:predicted nucleotidyltransferase component of viral defense system
VSGNIDLPFIEGVIDIEMVNRMINTLTKHYKVDLVPHEGMTLKIYSVITDKGATKLSFTCADTNKAVSADSTFYQFSMLKVANTETIFSLKSLVLSERHKKRDLFDLNEMMNRSMGDIEKLREVISRNNKMHYIDFILNRLLNWPQNDTDNIHFKNR